MVKRPKLKDVSKDIEMKVLCFLHYRYANSENVVFTERELEGVIKDVSLRILHFSLQELDIKQLIDSEYVKEGGKFIDGYSINRSGIDAVEGWDDDLYDQIAAGIDFLETVDEQQEKPSGIVREDEWEPLPLERSGSRYEHAVASTEAALTDIEGNNGYAESAPEERNRIVWSISEGLKHIKEGLPSRDQVISMLLKPLSYIAEKFATTSMGEVAKVAVKALLDWVGLG